MLTGTLLLAAAMVLLGGMGRVWPATLPWGVAALSGMLLVVSVAALLAMQGEPVGVIALDGLSAALLLPLGIAGLAAAGCRPDWRVAVMLGGAVLALLAADVLLLAVAVAGAAAASRRRIWAVGLAPVLVLLAGHAGFGSGFPAIRLGGGARDFAVPVLMLLPGALALWRPGSTMAEAILRTYVLARVMLDLCGPATPGWWGMPVLALGAAAAVLGSVRAVTAPGLDSILEGWGTAVEGMTLAGVGVALMARGADLPPLAALALSAALLHAVTMAAAMGLVAAGADAVQRGIGGTALDRMGGLLRRMPVTAVAMLVGAASLAALPPSAGFASQWLLLQSLLGAPRTGGLGPQLAAAAALAALGVAAALSAAASLRMAGLALLGVPRSGRADAATEARLWPALAAGAACCALLGLVPSGVLLLVRPAVRPLTGAGLDAAGVFWMPGLGDGAGYAPVLLAALLAAGTAAAMLGLRTTPARPLAGWSGVVRPAGTEAYAGAMRPAMPLVARLSRPSLRQALTAAAVALVGYLLVAAGR